MAITLRANKKQALTYSEMDQNFGSYFYSSSIESTGTELVLHYTSSIEVPINQASHRISLNRGVQGGVNRRVAYYKGASALSSSAGFIVDGTKVGINVDETNDIPLTYQLEVSGSIRASAGVLSNSDRRLKQKVRPINNASQIVSSLDGVQFQWTGKQGNNYGVIAQDIQKVLPEVVSQDNNGYLDVNYSSIIPILIEAVKDLQEEVKELKSRL
tara:strand:- start:2181 stop:2822 length:642 start_codon:yes stop_codon:yes gene_type:complete